MIGIAVVLILRLSYSHLFIETVGLCFPDFFDGRSITHLQQFNCLELSSKARKSGVLADILSSIAAGHHFCKVGDRMQQLFFITSLSTSNNIIPTLMIVYMLPLFFIGAVGV